MLKLILYILIGQAGTAYQQEVRAYTELWRCEEVRDLVIKNGDSGAYAECYEVVLVTKK